MSETSRTSVGHAFFRRETFTFLDDEKVGRFCVDDGKLDAGESPVHGKLFI
jgi:hypothetical protein